MLTEIIKRAWQLPDIKPKPYISLTLDDGGRVRTRLVNQEDKVKDATQRIMLQGEPNRRIKKILEKYGRHLGVYDLPNDSLNCHGAALYVTGYQERIRGVRARGIEAFYFGQEFETELLTSPPAFSPENPTIINLLRDCRGTAKP